ncbi:hypothetical protein D9M71_796050 [compost metagenome]
MVGLDGTEELAAYVRPQAEDTVTLTDERIVKTEAPIGCRIPEFILLRVVRIRVEGGRDRQHRRFDLLTRNNQTDA